MKKIGATSNKSIWLVWIVYLIPLGFFGCLFILFIAINKMEYSRWRSHTSPLPQNIQIDLCNKLSLSPEDNLCKADDILAPQFYPSIQAIFQSGEVSYEEVDKLLENYYWKSEPLGQMSTGQEYYRVFYDLRGDKQYAIVFYFYENGLLYELQEFYEGID